MDSVFLSRVQIYRRPEDSLIRLKPGILADVDIITDEQTVLFRIWKNITKNFKNN